MEIGVIGGGPAGLYAAILIKKSFPEAHIRIIERNRFDDTFGFGVVFSDQTLDAFESADRESYRAITDAFSYWDDIEIVFGGRRQRIGGNGFCGCSRRTLLLILQKRARELGVEISFQQEAPGLDAFPNADLIIAADGINSRVRETFRDHFQPETDLRPNHFTWMGSTRPFDAFNFFFRETEHGVFIAHCYQYEAGASTWVLETDPQTFAKAGLGAMDEAQSARFLEKVFAEELQGHKLITNRSLWRQFPMIRNKRWTMDDRVVLLGDAKATAHFSIGAGTKLAMEDAIALDRALVTAKGNVKDGLARFETGRREEVEKTQHSADVSLVWFEHVSRYIKMPPLQFAFGLMTRAKSITYDNLELRAPEFVAEVTADFARSVEHAGIVAKAERKRQPAYQPFRMRDMALANRLVMSPMCMYSAVDGMPQDFHLVHYGSRAMGGAGLVFTEMVCVSEDARITPGCAGLWNDAQLAAWRKIVDFVHGHSHAKICLQLGHAGRKGASKLMWDGMDRPLQSGGWEIMSASPLPYYPESRTPREMTRADMDRVKADFVRAAELGDRAGFDMLEMHAAHGYLLASFISPITNHRADEYGGSLANRLRYPLEVFAAMRDAWPKEKPMSVRISATDWIEGGIDGDDAVEIAEAFAQAGVDLVDVSTGQTSPKSRPIYGRMFQTPFAEQVRNVAKVSTMCVGNITSVDQANTLLISGRADLIAFGRPHLADPAFALRGGAWAGVSDMGVPKPYQPGYDQQLRNAPRDKADLIDLKMRAKPKSRLGESRLDAAARERLQAKAWT
ncbi:bifunctional salicylyl-CoA 5-hydroxylase/oxidoreductase [Terrarubrum flagellatum]|uniref:bifunctional salicylyl-CoA 5-hydroxylase/oxidoreductase n=1 Tax=Terrirubrum flagellatum TaxID=2895980 RepID=UPI0031450CBE